MHDNLINLPLMGNNRFNELDRKGNAKRFNRIIPPKEARLALDLTQENMAKSLDISKRQWNYYEKGEKEVPIMLELALRWLILTEKKSKRQNMTETVKIELTRLQKEQMREKAEILAEKLELDLEDVKKLI